ncbi:MAG: hypothetical protein AMXMBFR64_42180 [Myxococcales bacterium]
MLRLDAMSNTIDPMHIVKRVLVVAPLIVIAILIVGTFFSGYATVTAGQVAVIKNNITGQETVQETEGIIIHLPWGMTDVYVIDVTQRSLLLVEQDSVVIKTREGANVDTNVEITYNLIPSRAGQIVREIGMATGGADHGKIGDVVYSFVRARIRDSIGELNLEELARPEERTARIEEAKTRLNETMVNFGVEIQTVSATDWDYDDTYEAMIKRRKEADQIFVNQAAAQETNRKKQETSIAEQNRLQSNAIAEARGDAEKEIIAREAWAVEQRAKAEGQAYKRKKEAEGAFIQLENQAAALELELTKRAEGVRALADAYAAGGIGLVREALAAKMQGAKVVGRPWSEDGTPQRVQMQQTGRLPYAPTEDQ